MPHSPSTASTPVLLVADDDRLTGALRDLLIANARIDLIGHQHSLDEVFAQPHSPEAILIFTILLTPSGLRRWRSRAAYTALMRRAIMVAPYPASAGARIADACGIGAFVSHEAIPTALVPTITHLARTARWSSSRLHDDAAAPQRFEQQPPEHHEAQREGERRVARLQPRAERPPIDRRLYRDQVPGHLHLP